MRDQKSSRSEFKPCGRCGTAGPPWYGATQRGQPAGYWVAPAFSQPQQCVRHSGRLDPGCCLRRAGPRPAPPTPCRPAHPPWAQGPGQARGLRGDEEEPSSMPSCNAESWEGGRGGGCLPAWVGFLPWRLCAGLPGARVRQRLRGDEEVVEYVRAWGWVRLCGAVWGRRRGSWGEARSLCAPRLCAPEGGGGRTADDRGRGTGCPGVGCGLGCGGRPEGAGWPCVPLGVVGKR